MSAGLYTCANLAEVQLKADQIWADASKNRDYVAKAATLSAILDNQTVRISELQDPDKDKSVKLYWVQNCDTAIADCSNECSVGGAEPEASCQTHTLDICRTTGFTIEEKGFRAIAPTVEEAIAVSLLRKIKTLDEDLAKKAVAKLNSNKGVNAYTGGKGTVSGFTTTVPAAYWNASLFSYLNLVADKNKFTSPYIISGTNLYEANWNAKMNMANADGKGAANMFESLPAYFDTFNVDTQLDPEKATFLIDKNALAFISKNYYPFAPGSDASKKYGGVGGSVGEKFQVASKNLKGVFYDVTYKIRCENNKIYHDFTLNATAGLLRNPVGCDLNNTGILKFLCA